MAKSGATRERRLGINFETFAGGAAVGVAAFVVGYLCAFLVMPDSTTGNVVTDSIPNWKIAGWFFYNGHLADFTVSVDAGSLGSETTSENLIDQTSDSTAELLYAVPPVLLGVGGAVLARIFGSTGEWIEGAKAGALGIVGYLPLVFVGVFLTEHSDDIGGGQFFNLPVDSVNIPDGSVTFGIEMGAALLLAGILYPLLFGALGGAVASYLEGA